MYMLETKEQSVRFKQFPLALKMGSTRLSLTELEPSIYLQIGVCAQILSKRAI